MNSLMILFIVVPILVAILLVLNLLLAVNKPDTEKVSAYECGFNGLIGQTRSPFNIQYYLIGVLFLVFDLEILILYPYATVIYETEIYGFIIVIIFFIVLTLGFVYEFSVGALYFTDQRSAIKQVKLEKPFTSFSSS